MSGRQIAFSILLIATLAVYATMLVWSLPVVSRAAEGLAPFDMRPGGYSFAEAQAFLSALTPDGAGFYRDVQQTLDTFYPALLAATLFFAIAGLAPAGIGGWRWLLALFAIPGSAFDYLENAAVARMLAAGPDGLTPELVESASRWTLLKSWFTTIAFALLAVLVIRRALARFRRADRNGGPS
jgi:hypothetical protein